MSIEFKDNSKEFLDAMTSPAMVMPWALLVISQLPVWAPHSGAKGPGQSLV